MTPAKAILPSLPMRLRINTSLIIISYVFFFLYNCIIFNLFYLYLCILIYNPELIDTKYIVL